MGYATAFYANRGDYRSGGFRRGDPGLLSGIKNVAGKVFRGVGRVMPGPIGAAAGALGGTMQTTTGSAPVIGPIPQVPTRAQRGRGVQAIGISPMGTVGVKFKKRRRMNPGNARAARRAINRIKGARNLLKSIERQLPKVRTKGGGGSAGVITAAEARRMLRA